MATWFERSGRDIVVEISAAKLQDIVLARIRSTPAITCLDTSALAALGVPTGDLEHLGVWPLAFWLTQDAAGLTANLSLRAPPAIAPGGVLTVAIPFAALLQFLQSRGVDLLPADLPLLREIGGRLRGAPTYRAVDGGALAIGFDIDLGGRAADEGRWSRFRENFLAGRDWAIAVDAAVMQAVLAASGDQLAARSRHPGIAGDPVDPLPGKVELVGFGYPEPGQVRHLGEHGADNRWTAALAGSFGGGTGFDDVLLYDAATGEAETWSTDGRGAWTQLRRHDLGAGWDVLAAGHERAGDVVLAYRRDSGAIEIFQSSASGRFRRLRRHDGAPERAGWDLLVPAVFAAAITGPEQAGGPFLGHSFASWQTAVMVPVEGGGLATVATLDWDRAWTSVVALNHEGSAAFLFYDESDGRAEVWAVRPAPDGSPLSRVATARLRRGLAAFAWLGAGAHTQSVLFGYDRDDGIARLYTVGRGAALEGDAGITRVARYDDWRIGWDLIVAGHFSAEFPFARGLLLYDRASWEPSIVWEYLRPTWGNPIFVRARGAWQSPHCGGIDFEVTIKVDLVLEGGRISERFDVGRPALDFWDGAQLTFCYGAFGGPAGAAIAALLFSFAGFVGTFIGFDVPDQAGPSVSFDLPAGVRLFGTQLDHDAGGLLVRGDARVAIPPPPRLRLLPGTEPLVFRETGGWICRGEPARFLERSIHIDSAPGENELRLCDVALTAASDPGFVIRSVSFPPLAGRPANVGVAADRRSLTGLPLGYRPRWPALTVTIAYEGPPDRDASGGLRVVSSDPDRPFIEIPLRAVSSLGAAAPTWDPPQIRIAVANTEIGTQPHALYDCRLDEIRVIQDEGPVAALVIRNQGSRPLFLCEVALDDPDGVFEIESGGDPFGEQYVRFFFYPHEAMRTYRGELRIRTSAAAQREPDIVVPVDARVEAEPGRKASAIGISAGLLEHIYDLVGARLCMPMHADICRAGGLFAPLAPGATSVGLVTVGPLPPGAGELAVEDARGVVVRDVSGEPTRRVAIELPPGGGQGPDPCIARLAGIDPVALGRVRIGMHSMVVSPRATVRERAEAIAGARDVLYLGTARGISIHGVDRPGEAAPLGAVELPPVHALAIAGDCLLAAAEDTIFALDLADARAPRVVAKVRLPRPIRSIAADRAGVFATDGDALYALELGTRGVSAVACDAQGGFALGLLPGAVYVAHERSLSLWQVTGPGKLVHVSHTSCAGPIRALGHWGKTILAVGDGGTDGFDRRGDRLVATTWFRGRHWALDLVPDDEHRRLLRSDADGVTVFDVVPRQLDPRQFAEAMELRWRPARRRAA